MAGEGVAAAAADVAGAAVVTDVAAAADADVQAEVVGVPVDTVVVRAGLVAGVILAGALRIRTVTESGITSRLVCYNADST